MAGAVGAGDRNVGLRTLGKGCGAINNCRKMIRIAPIQSHVSKEPCHCDGGSCRNARNCFKSVQPLLKIADHLRGQCTAHTCFNCWSGGADEEQINTIYVNFLDAQACRASWKAFGQWVNIIRKASPKTPSPEHALYAARNIVAFIQGTATPSKKVMGELSSEERISVVEKSSALVLSLLKCDGDCGIGQSLSERVRRLSERAPQQGLECSRQALHKWQAMHRKEVLISSPMVCERRCPLRFAVGHQGQSRRFTADPQCVAEHYAQEWKRR